MSKEIPNDDRRTGVGCSVLATDLDGTLIPLPNEPQNQTDLETLAHELKSQGVTLIYITGRHFARQQTKQSRSISCPDPIG